MKTHNRKLAVMGGLVIVLLLMFAATAAGQNMKFTIMHNFANQGDGGIPGALMMDAKGIIYGPAGNGAYTDGVVFKMTHRALNGAATAIYNFGAVNGDGSGPLGPLVEDANGVIYGVTFGGGEQDSGTLFALTPPKPGSIGGVWTETKIHDFGYGYDGVLPPDGLSMDSAGNLYPKLCAHSGLSWSCRLISGPHRFCWFGS
jgi:hypothetical protein